MNFDLLQGREAAEGVGRGNETAGDVGGGCLVFPGGSDPAITDRPPTCTHVG